MFKKKDTSDENVAKQSIRKMDKVVTGLLLSGVIASIYGVKKLHDKQKHEEDTTPDTPTSPPEDTQVKRPSLWSRIFSRHP